MAKEVDKLVYKFNELDCEVIAMKEQQLELAKEIVEIFNSSGVKHEWDKEVEQLKKEIHKMKVEQGLIGDEEE